MYGMMYYVELNDVSSCNDTYGWCAMTSPMDDVLLNYHVVMRYHDIIGVSYDDEFYAILLIHMICYVLLNYYGVISCYYLQCTH